MKEYTTSLTPVIEIDNISVSFEGFKALTDVTTKIMPHKVHFFIGPNGAGKTTLLDIICGKTRPSQGKIIYHGGTDLGIRKYVNIDLTKLSESEIVSEGIGRKFQAPSVFTSLTVWENMEISLKGNKSVWGSLFFKITNQQKEQIENILNFISLADKKHAKASSLSHGQKQWLEIGMLLVQEPVVLLLDEPVAGMGKEETLKTGQLIKKISEKYAVIVVEHDMEFVRAVADRVTVMHEGKILVEGTAEDALSDEKVRAVYLGRGKFHKSGKIESAKGGQNA